MSTNKKNRPSPSQSATQFKIGDIAKGNDGNKWIIKANKNGINRWTRFNKSSSKHKHKHKHSKIASRRRVRPKSKKYRRIRSKRRTYSYSNRNYSKPKYRKIKRKSKMKPQLPIRNNQIDNISPNKLVKYITNNRITNIIFNKISPELKNNRIKVYFVPQKTSNLYLGDHWHHYLVDHYGGYDTTGNFIVFIIYFNNDREIDTKQKIGIMLHIDLKYRIIVNDILDKYLKKNMEWKHNIVKVPLYIKY